MQKVALTIKTASGIRKFQDDKGYGALFNQLFALVHTRDSCQPELAVEPSAKNDAGEEDGSTHQTHLHSSIPIIILACLSGKMVS